MKGKDDRKYLLDMRETARRVQQKVAGISKEQFDADDNLRLALTHLLQIIGEAAYRTSSVTRDRFPQLPWPAIIKMRHRLVHDYGRIDEEYIWKTAVNRMQELIDALKDV